MYFSSDTNGIRHHIAPAYPYLIDKHGRRITYMRLAVTDRCNLRCTYCMPPDGVPPCSHHEILTFDEITRLVKICSQLGVKKIRITGGEPFVRKNVIHLIRQLAAMPVSVHLTTNGVETARYLPQLMSVGIAGINLSLDSLQPDRFQKITRRNLFSRVWQTLETALQLNIPLKINTVIQRNINDDELVDISHLAQRYPVDVRFIEEMKFNGRRKSLVTRRCTAMDILTHLQKSLPNMVPAHQKNATAQYYIVPGFQGKIGVIAGESRCFCGECNRIRVTAQGMLKTCLYAGNALNLRNMLRSSMSDDQLKTAIQASVFKRHPNGFEAEQAQSGNNAPSMAAIGG